MVAALSMIILPSALTMPSASAEDPGFLDITKGVAGWDDGRTVSPGEAFQYTITVTCTNTGSGGCTNAVLTDQLPPWIVLNGDVSVTGASADVEVDGSDITVTFTDSLNDPVDGIGIPDATTVTIVVPVIVDSSIPADESGVPLPNTAAVTGDNTNSAEDDFTVVPNIPVTLQATAAKGYEPSSAIYNPGPPATQTTLTLEGGNGSNVSVDTLQLQDPADPAADPNPFDLLALTGEPEVTLPEGADAVVLEYWVGGEWSNAPPNFADVRGVRATFTSSEGTIPPGAGGSVVIDLEHRADVENPPSQVTVENDLIVTVTDEEETSDPAEATDDYTFDNAEIPLAATKVFNPDPIAVGTQSTATLTVTNTSELTLDTLSVTEPSPGTDPNPFENGLAFDGFTDGVQWPSGATGATVSFTLATGEVVEVAADSANTLPAPPEGAEVVGFTVTYTGAIVPGAETVVPFTVTAGSEQDTEEVTHVNEIAASSTAPGGYVGEAEAQDTLTTIVERLSVVVGKSISPQEILSVPGEDVVVQLSGHLEDFPASTTDATQIIVQDPIDLENDNWYAAFAPTQVVATPIPDGATLTVEYFDGTDWVAIDILTDIAGPAIITEDLPAEVIANAQGLRFIYDSETGFAPGATVLPNVVHQLRADFAGSDEVIENCAGATASNDLVEDEADPAGCAEVNLNPVEPGPGADLLEKSWDIAGVGERSGSQAGLTLSWSTGGRSNLDSVVISDTADPSVAALDESVFDAFDLVRVEPITNDPLLTYDQVAAVEFFSLETGEWAALPNDPCPGACDGTFPGVTIPAELRGDVIGIRLVFVESPTRAERHGDNPVAPPVGSGVARGFENNRDIPLTFAIRDELRSNADVPVLAADEFNAGTPGAVNNVAGAEGFVGDEVVVGDEESDIINITPVSVQVDATKSWTGGPLGAPPAGSDPENYPTATITLGAHNQTPAKIDRLTLADPVGDSDPFDTFDVIDFSAITPAIDIGATDVVVTLTLADGSELEMTRDEALAADAAALEDVVGLEVVYTGRINAGAQPQIVLDVRLRAESRTDGTPIVPPAPPEQLIVDNELSVLGEDLVNYPDVPVRDHGDTAEDDILINSPEIGVEVTKTFNPDSQVEPDRSPVTATLTAQPQGPSRANLMQVEDIDASFWNQYDFVGLGSPFPLTAPINEVRVDLFTGGEFVVTGEGDVVLEGGDWVLGETGATATLPDVPAGEVQGIRFTMTRDGDSIWENPANPTQPLPFQVERRVELRTGGEVPSTLEGNEPAPGETVAGEATNTIDGLVQGRDLDGDGNPISAVDDAEDVITYRHLPSSVSVTKGPQGGYPTGQDIPYVLTFTNTGQGAIVNPVITDRLPADDAGPLLVFSPDLPEGASPYDFALEGAPPADPNGPPMPVVEDDIDITVSEAGDLITFAFPDGTVLEPGQTYTIGVELRFRDGLPGQTQVTNTTGIIADRPWDDCAVTLDEETGECVDDTTVSPLSSGALRGVKSVRALDDDLGVAGPETCEPNDEGFYVSRCTPTTKPGEQNEWRLKFTNTGNQPIGRVVAIDRMPRPGDSAAIVPIPRLSEWRPQLDDVQFEGTTSGEITNYQVFYTSDEDLCLDDLNMGAGCDEGDWLPWDDSVDPAAVEALKFEVDFAPEARFQPLGVLTIDLLTTAPAQAPVPDAGEEFPELPIAWNTVAAAAQAWDGDTAHLIRRTEGNKVGATLATGPLVVLKEVEGPAAEFAPESFDLQVQCVSAGENVDLGENGLLTVTDGEIASVANLPWGAECTIADDSAESGASEFEATTATIALDPETVPIVIATNTYNYASLSLTKAVDSDAVDAEGNPIGYGPFGYEVACTFLGETVLADGYDSSPMLVELTDGESVDLTGLPAAAACTATETETDGAAEVISEGETGDGPVEGDETIELTLTSDEGSVNDPVTTNTVTYTNVFATGSIDVTKEVVGDAADYGVGPFEIAVACTLDDESVWDGSVELNADNELQATIGNIAAGAVCTFEEAEDGGATSIDISPNPVDVGGDAAAEVTVTNTFEVGEVSVQKLVEGDGADFGAGPFTVELACTFQGVPVDLGDDASLVLSSENDLAGTWTGLPVGAECGLTETDDGGATSTAITPESVMVPEDDAPEVAAFEVTNTFDLGEVAVSKVIEGPGAEQFGAGPFTVELACTFQGEPIDVADAEFVLSEDNGYAGSWTGLPVGAECGLTETDDGGATLAEITPTSLVVGVEAEETASFEVTNHFELGQVAVGKIVDGEGAAYGTGPFEVELACTFQGEPVDLGDDAQRVLSVEDGLTGAWDGLPVGAECSLAETEDGSATSTAIVPESLVVGDAQDGPVTFEVTNTFDLGEVAVSKIVDGAGAEIFGSGPFTVELACTFNGQPIDVADAELVLSEENGLAGSWEGLPVGAECGLTETDDGGATSTAIMPASVTVGAGEVEPVAFEVTNTFDLEDLSVEKIIEGDAAAYGTGPFTVELACTFEGEPVDVTDAELVLSEENGLSGGWTGLPVGAQCSVTETDTGGASTIVVDPASLTVGEEDTGFTVTNSFDLGEVAVAKIVDGPGAEQFGAGPFTVDLACTFQGQPVDIDEPSLVLSEDNGYAGTWADLPIGSECSTTETDDGGATLAQISPETLTVIPGSEPAGFEVTNTFEVGQVAVGKIVDGAAADLGAGPFTVELACTFQGEPVDLGDDAFRELSPEDGMTGAWDGLPVGAECSLTEPEDGGATTVTITPDAVTVGEETEAPATFEVTNTFDLGEVAVSKIVDGPGAEQFGAGPFTVELACTFQGEPVNVSDASLVLSEDNGYAGSWAELPVGAECSVTETDDGGATLAQIAPASVVVGPEAEETVAFEVTNTFEVGQVAVGKVVDGAGAEQFGSGPFEVQLACTFEGEPVDLGEDAFRGLSVEDGMTGSWDGLPVGAECSLTETEDGGATTVTITPDTVTIGEESEAPATFELTNTFELGEVSVQKIVDGAAAEFGAGPFTVELACTFQGEDIDLGEDASRVLSAENDLSGSWAGLPVGAECGLTETEDGGATSSAIVPESVTVAVADDEAAGFEVTNTFDAGPVSVQKIVDGDGADFGDGPFTVELACTFQGEDIDLGEDAERVLSAENGLSGSWAGLPVGAECALTETDDGGATSSEVQPSSIVVGDGGAAFEVTNTFDVGQVDVTKLVTGDGADFGDGPFTVELACTFQGEDIDLGEDASRVLSAENDLSGSWAGLPVGAECSLTETDDGGATSTAIAPASVTVAAGDAETAAFEVTNTFELGEVEVTKVIEGDAAAFAAGPFTVELACTFQGEDIDLGEDADRVLSDENDLSGSWAGLPVGAECGLTETEDGGATSTEILPANLVVGADEDTGFTVTNTFDAAPVDVTKLLEGEGADDATGPFTMELACTFQGTAIDLGDDAERILSPEDGMTGTWTELPVGAVCGLTETDDGGADSTEIVPEQIVVGIDEIAAFTVTNTFEEGPVDPTDPPTPTDPPSPTDPPTPTDPPSPTEPPTPTDPPSPTEPPAPTDPPSPTEPPAPTDPPSPTEPVDPTDPPIETGGQVIERDATLLVGASIALLLALGGLVLLVRRRGDNAS